MAPRKIPITPHGYDYLQKQLKHFKTVERPNVILAIAEARAHGDLSENAEYDAAKEHQGFVEAKILELENAVALGEVIDPMKVNADLVSFGATVVVEDSDTGEENTYVIVGDLESAPNIGRIAVSSPVARSLLGKAEGEEAEVRLPSGKKFLEIMEIRYEEILPV